MYRMKKEENIMKFSVHQMIPSHRKYLAEFKADELFQITFYGKVLPSIFLAHYSKVCEIVAEDLNEVFQIGNIGPEEKITRLDRMHSISVGDAIRVEEGPEMGYIYIVKPEGFERFHTSNELEVA